MSRIQLNTYYLREKDYQAIQDLARNQGADAILFPFYDNQSKSIEKTGGKDELKAASADGRNGYTYGYLKVTMKNILKKIKNSLIHMEKTVTKRQRFWRGIYRGISLTSLAFVFQACYGQPKDFGWDVCIRGIVTSQTTNAPIAGIRVSVENQPQYEITDSNGRFVMYLSKEDAYTVKFEDQDSTQNGSYLPKDTVVRTDDSEIVFEISLNAQ